MRSTRPCMLALLLLAGVGTRAAAQHDHSHGSGLPVAKGENYLAVDGHTTTHEFEQLEDGGRILLKSDSTDVASVTALRARMQELTRAMQAGQFDIPMLTHNEHVPGADLMARRHARIRYDYRDVSGGGEIVMKTDDPMARTAIHGFLVFQRSEHTAHDH